MPTHDIIDNRTQNLAGLTSLLAKAHNYRDIAQLEMIHRRWLEIETEIKTSRTSDVLALDLMVAGVAR